MLTVSNYLRAQGLTRSNDDGRIVISWKDVEICEACELSLGIGEYFDACSNRCSEDEEESDDSSVEEAEEVVSNNIDEEINKLHDNIRTERALKLTSREDEINSIINGNYSYADGANNNGSPTTLMDMPDILLESIFHYAFDKPGQVVRFERVCKRFRVIVISDGFYRRHPGQNFYATDDSRELWVERWEARKTIALRKKLVVHDSRELSLIRASIREIRLHQNGKYEMGVRNIILSVLFDGADGVDTFRNMCSSVLSRMIHAGNEVRFRLRGDTVGYLAELIQEYMIRRLEGALSLALNSERLDVQRRDLIAHSNLDPVSQCNVPLREHGYAVKSNYLPCTCSLSSTSGTVWRWPKDDCQGILPLEASRRIIRGLAYRSGIIEMNNEVFVVAEAELYHVVGLLLVEAYESTFEMGNSGNIAYLDASETLSYNNCPGASVDMFMVPPPPMCLVADKDEEAEPTYTIVPGQIRAAAERRSIFPYHVYGMKWITSSEFTLEEEKEIEESYYYGYPCDDTSDENCFCQETEEENAFCTEECCDGCCCSDCDLDYSFSSGENSSDSFSDMELDMEWEGLEAEYVEVNLNVDGMNNLR